MMNRIKRVVCGLALALLATAAWGGQMLSAQGGGAKLECSFDQPYLCVGRYIEVTDFNGRGLAGRVYGITVAGEGFNLDGHFIRGSARDQITILEQRSGEQVTLDLASLASIRDLGATPPPADGSAALDVLLVVSAALLLALVVLLLRRERVSAPAPAQGPLPAVSVAAAPSALAVTRADAQAFLDREPPLPALFDAARVSVGALNDAGLPVDEVTYLAVGGGMGSFTWADYLRIMGVDAAQIMAIGATAHPYDVCRRLCHTAQLSDGDRLRSDSGSTPDNLWGWPGYALREGWRELRRGRVGAALGLLWQLAAETALAEPYTPRVGDVFASVDREAQRINWYDIRRAGVVSCLRKTDDGRYAAVYAHYDGERWSRRVVLARYVQVATGAAGPLLLPELLDYRARTGDAVHAVNAYEDHEHVFAALADKGGVVVLRGRGITAAAELERLAAVRAQNPTVCVLHIMHAPVPANARVGRASRPVLHHWTLQPYNWPKSFFGGTWQAKLERADGGQRRFLLTALGGVTTPPRRDFVGVVRRGLREGWYQVYLGRLAHINSENGTLLVGAQDLTDQPAALFAADYLIDATGLDTDISSSPLLADLAQHYGLARSAWGNLEVSADFELAQMRNEGGRVFAAGVITAGGFYAPVDSFFGLQFAAQRSLDALAQAGAPGVRRLDGWRSFSQWFRWARGERP